MRPRNLFVCAGLALGTANAGAPALARVILDTGTPSETCQQCVLPLNRIQWLGGMFHVGAPTTIQMIDGFIGATSGNKFTIALWSDDGITPGALLDTAIGLYKGKEGWNGLDTLNWRVSTGYYWVAFEVTGADNLVGGFMPDTAPHKLKLAASGDGAAWSPDGKLGLGVRILRPPDRTRNVDAPFGLPLRGGGSPGSVPEPAAWTMMLAGLGCLGAALRARRAKAIPA